MSGKSVGAYTFSHPKCEDVVIHWSAYQRMRAREALVKAGCKPGPEHLFQVDGRPCALYNDHMYTMIRSDRMAFLHKAYRALAARLESRKYNSARSRYITKYSDSKLVTPGLNVCMIDAFLRDPATTVAEWQQMAAVLYKTKGLDRYCERICIVAALHDRLAWVLYLFEKHSDIARLSASSQKSLTYLDRLESAGMRRRVVLVLNDAGYFDGAWQFAVDHMWVYDWLLRQRDLCPEVTGIAAKRLGRRPYDLVRWLRSRAEKPDNTDDGLDAAIVGQLSCDDFTRALKSTDMRMDQLYHIIDFWINVAAKHGGCFDLDIADIKCHYPRFVCPDGRFNAIPRSDLSVNLHYAIMTNMTACESGALFRRHTWVPGYKVDEARTCAHMDRVFAEIVEREKSGRPLSDVVFDLARERLRTDKSLEELVPKYPELGPRAPPGTLTKAAKA